MVIDGYGLVFIGAAGSDIIVDNLMLVSSPLSTPTPTPTPAGTPTPSPTPTPITTPTPYENSLFDGGFESSLGTFAAPLGWQISPGLSIGVSYNYTKFCAAEICGGQNLARSQYRWAQFGDPSNTAPVTKAQIEQDIRITPGYAARMEFGTRWSDIAPDSTAYLAVMMDGVEVYRLNESISIEATYTYRTVDLSAFADGQTHRFAVGFRAQRNFRPDGTERPQTGSDILLLDDVKLVAAPVGSISGRVTTPTGLGLRNAVVTLTDSQGGVRKATTSSFGNYTFTDVPLGQTYFVSVSSKRYRFAARSLTVDSSLTNVDFVGLE